MSRSSLARSNQHRDAFFVLLFERLYARCAQHASKHQLGFKGKLFPQVDDNRKKAAFKMSRLLKLNRFAKRDLIELLKPAISPPEIPPPQMTLALTRI